MAAGVVEAVGEGVTAVAPGDHVSASFIPSCGQCRYCVTGRQNLCDEGAGAFVKGMVTDGLDKAIAAHDDIDEVVAIGPPIMMKACSDLTRPYGIKTMVSLNPIMIDGTGMCGGCRVKVSDKTQFCCVDGPDFDGFAVDFEELLNRNSLYLKEEKDSLLFSIK